MRRGRRRRAGEADALRLGVDGALRKQIEQPGEDRPDAADRKHELTPVRQGKQQGLLVAGLARLAPERGRIRCDQIEQYRNQVDPLAVHHDAKIEIEPVDARAFPQLGGDLAGD
jgi:hypothetical protein